MSDRFYPCYLGLSKSLHWFGRVMAGDVLVVKTHLFRRGDDYSVDTDTCHFLLFQGLSEMNRQLLAADCHHYRNLDPLFESGDIILPLIDDFSVNFHLDCLETLLSTRVDFIGSNLNHEDEPDILIECFEIKH